MDKSQFNLESEWAKLSKEKQDRMNEDCDVIASLVTFQNNATLRLFQYMYGGIVGIHLFSKLHERCGGQYPPVHELPGQGEQKKDSVYPDGSG